MFKFVVLAALVVFASAVPVPEPKADPKPGVLAAAYTAPVVAAAPVAYSAYTAPLAYSSYYAPSVYAAGYSAYSPYASYVVV